MLHSLRHHMKHALGGYLLESRALLAAARAPAGADERPAFFVFFGRGRSGSTMLVEMLNAHPDVDCLGEILRYRTLAPALYVRNRMKRCERRARGFKLLSYQIRDLSVRHRGAIRAWFENEGVTIFHLRRENLLQHAISNIYAARRRAYHSTDSGAARHKSIHIAPEELMQWMNGSQSLLEFEMRFLEGLDRFEIVYERDLAEYALQQGTYSRILSRLGLPYKPSVTSLKKVTPPDLRALVENFSEIESALSRTTHKRYLPCFNGP